MSLIRPLDPDHFLYACQIVFARNSAQCPYGVMRGEGALDVLLSTMIETNWNPEEAHAFLERFVSLGELALQPQSRGLILSSDDAEGVMMQVPAVRMAATFPLVCADIGFESHAFLSAMSV